MARPVRSAAQEARALILAGIGVKEVDAIGARGMTEEEEDELNAEISGENMAEFNENDEDEVSHCGSASATGPANIRFSSYEELDVQPPVIKFRPPQPPGLHLTERVTRCGVQRFVNAIDFFQLFITDELLEMIVENTNLYAWLHIHDKPSYGKSDGSWESTCVQELKNYIALIIYNGFGGQSDIESNWCQETLFCGGWCPRFLSKNRFKALSAMLHISKPGDEDPNDKLAKIRPMLTHMQTACKQFFYPMQDVSIDERMVASKGRSPIRQYMPKKPTKFGYKLWCICDPTTGYTFDFSVYTGKGSHRGPHGLGFDVVTSLVEPYKNRGHVVYFDNFFSSTQLAESLLENGTYICGTMQPWRRGFPQILKDKSWTRKAQKGTMRYVRQDNVLMLQWLDKRIVHMISTLHRGHEHVLVFRRNKNKDGVYKRELLRVPTCIRSYNKNMGGVDLADQMIETYNCLMKVTRWWKTLFFHMVDLAILNSFILFSMWREAHPDVPGLQRRRRFSHKQFRTELVRQLARIHETELPPIYMPAVKRRKSLNCTGPHDPAYTKIRRNCHVCYLLYRKQHKSFAKCSDPQCDVYLCFNKRRNCFPTWHSRDFDKYRFKLTEE